MDIHSSASESLPAQVARLVIHIQDSADEPAWPRGFALRRLWSTNPDGAQQPTCAPPMLQVHDLAGRRVFTSDDPGPLIHVTLAAGTYHVTLLLRKLRRRYTLTLTAGELLDLHVAADRS